MTARRGRILTWLASLFAAMAFLVVLVVFAREIADYRRNVEAWARRDLRTQARLTAANLSAALETQDFRRIDAIAHSLESDDILLTIYSGPGGVFYRSPTRTTPDIRESATVDEYRIELGFPETTVFRPFNRAVRGFLLAALVGVLGMFVVFFTLYRQRVKIRELARLERFRRDFVADVSHEIKTPLTGILGAVSLLEEPSASRSSEDTAVLLSLVSKEANRLNGLVQQILDLARLEREGEVLDRRPTDLAALVRETVDRLRPKAEAAGVTMDVRLGDVPQAVCDGRLVSQAIANLVENALRHAHSQDVVVMLATHGKGVRLSVEDHGVGIPPEHVAHIFERFHRVDPARAAETGGAGLGLAIVRRIARLHGGDVTCTPAVPRGTRFTFDLPGSPWLSETQGRVNRQKGKRQ